MVVLDDAASPAGVLSSTPPSKPTLVPSTPKSVRGPEQYGDTLEMYDSPRHSHESSVSLLHGQHSRSSSAASFDSFVGPGERSFVQLPPGLPRLDEEDNIAIYEEDEEHDDEFPRQTGRRSSLHHKIENDDAVERTSASGSSRNHRKRTTTGNGQHHRRKSSILPPVIEENVSKAAMYVKENRGLLMIAASQAAFAAMNAMVKIMTSSEVAVPIWELIFTRMSITWFFCYLYMRVKGVEDPLLGPKGIRGWLVVRGFVGFFGLFGSYYSLQFLSLSDATVLAFLSPTVTGILAAVFLHEPYTAKEAISGLISLGGAILVAQPSFLFGSLAEEEDPEERLLAVGVALIGVCAASAAYVTIRKIGKRAHALHSVTYFCIGCVCTSICMPIFVESQEVILPYKPVFWLYLTGIGICGFIAQFLMAKALQIERVGRALLGNYTQLPWALLLQYFIFGEVMDLLSTLGAVIIMGSTCWVVLTRQKDVPDVKKHKERALSFSSSVAGGEFSREDFDPDEDMADDATGPRKATQAGSQARYTALSDQDASGMEAGLLPSNGSAASTPVRHDDPKASVVTSISASVVR